MSQPTVIITTNKGPITVVLTPEYAPKTVANFTKLAKEGFYNNLKFHRVIPGFVAQGGDPQTKGVMGTDWTAVAAEAAAKKIPLAGTGGPGYTIKAEFNAQKHVTGSIAMARSSDPDSAGSQFYICLAPQSFLDNQYTVFGQVTAGMDTVLALAVGDTMEKVEVIEPAAPAAEAAQPVTANSAATPNPTAGK